MKEKSRVLIYPLLIMVLILMVTTTCKKKEEVPVVTTYVVSEITKTTATCGGLILSDGGAAVTARGVCWSTGATPTTADSKSASSTSVASFTSAITDLTGGTTYYVRAYATNSAGTGYGTAESFTTLPVEVPALTTSTVSDITETAATCGGNITSDGGSAVTARGVCWSTGAIPTIADSKTTDGTDAGEFISAITGLTGGTIYYVRAYATNSAGTGYGTAISFTTLAPAGFPVLTTSTVNHITSTTATCGGNITSDGGTAITARGVCWSTEATPTIDDNITTDGDGTGEFTSAITGLTTVTTYYVRAYATNSTGTAYGTVVSFRNECNIDNLAGTWDVVQTGSFPQTGTATIVRGAGADELVIKASEGLPALLAGIFIEWGELFQSSVPPAGDISLFINIGNGEVTMPSSYWGSTLPINPSGDPGPWDYHYIGTGGTMTGCLTVPTITITFTLQWANATNSEYINEVVLTKQ